MDKKFNTLINYVLENISVTTIKELVSDTEVHLDREVKDEQGNSNKIGIILTLENVGTAREMYGIKIYDSNRELTLSSKNITGSINIIEDACDDITKNKKKTNKEYLNEGKELLLLYLENKGYDISRNIALNEESNNKVRIDVENLDIISFRIDIIRKNNNTLFRLVSVKKVKVNKEILYDCIEDELDTLINNYEDFGVISVIEEYKVYKLLKKKENSFLKKGYSVKERKLYGFSKLSDSYIKLKNKEDEVTLYVDELPTSSGAVNYSIEVNKGGDKGTKLSKNKALIGDYFNSIRGINFKNVDLIDKKLYSALVRISEHHNLHLTECNIEGVKVYKMEGFDNGVYLIHPHLIVNLETGRCLVNKTDINFGRCVGKEDRLSLTLKLLAVELSKERKEISNNDYSDRRYKTDNNRMLALFNYLNINKNELNSVGINYRIEKGTDYKDSTVVFESSKYLIIVSIDLIKLVEKGGKDRVLYKRSSYTSQTKEMLSTKSFMTGISGKDAGYNEIKKAILKSFNLKNKYHKDKRVVVN